MKETARQDEGGMRYWLAACAVSLTVYLVMSQAVRDCLQELGRLVSKFLG